MTVYTQFPLEKKYDEMNGALFLFYNNIGCVIERIDKSRGSTYELELHDKSRPRRFNLEKNRTFGLFALREKIFVCGNSNLVVFQE